MGANLPQRRNSEVWRVVRRQHGVISRDQLVRLGFSRKEIRHRLARGRLHLLFSGVYLVGRPEANHEARWMGAVLACRDGAALSHFSAAGLWGIRQTSADHPEISVPAARFPRLRGIRIHRRSHLPTTELTRRHGIPVTSPALTIVDIAPCLNEIALLRAIDEADRLELTDPVRLRKRVEALPRLPGVGIVRKLLDRQTFRLADSELERRFLPLARRAGLPPPLTRSVVNGYRVDFFWPDLGLVVETDGLRYHRTPAQQGRDRQRDQVHTRTGLTCLRFTHQQVGREPDVVVATLAEVAARLAARRII